FDRGQAGGEHECRLPDQFHRRKANDGFAGATWEHDHSTAALFGTSPMERFGCLSLVIAHRKRPPRSGSVSQRHMERIDCSITGEIFGRESGRDESLLPDTV